jgi:glucose-6-phosphate 1-dehydrogenase
MTDEEFRATLRDGVVAHSRQALAEDKWKDFAQHLFYVSGGNEDPNTYATLKSRTEEIERNLQLPGNRIFYLSIPPSSFASVCEGLEQAGLATKPEAHTPYARIIVEKPVGRDLASAQAINQVTGRVFDESQIFTSITIWEKKLFRISWSSGLPTASSSRSGTTSTSIMCRSR